MKAAIIGSTGLVGSNLTELIAKDNSFEEILSISRQKTSVQPPNIKHIEFKTGNYIIDQSIDSAFCCLGTTMKKAGSKSAFQNVDLNMVVDFAKKAKDAGAKRFAMVSSIGANADSKNFYLRTKGQAEAEIIKIGFENLIIARPSLLLGKRKEKRLGEDIGKFIYHIIKFIFVGPLKKYKGIHANDVAKAMLYLVKNEKSTTIVESDDLMVYSSRYQFNSNKQ